MAHSPKQYAEMGRLVADAGKRDWDELTAEYGATLMEGLGVMGCKRSGRGQACECAPAPDGIPEESPLQRVQRLPAVRPELLGLIEDCRRGLLPLIVPLTLLKHHLGRYPMPEWVHLQVYLNPYPKELMLRNHV